MEPRLLAMEPVSLTWHLCLWGGMGTAGAPEEGEAGLWGWGAVDSVRTSGWE